MDGSLESCHRSRGHNPRVHCGRGSRRPLSESGATQKTHWWARICAAGGLRYNPCPAGMLPIGRHSRRPRGVGIPVIIGPSALHLIGDCGPAQRTNRRALCRPRAGPGGNVHSQDGTGFADTAGSSREGVQADVGGSPRAVRHRPDRRCLKSSRYSTSRTKRSRPSAPHLRENRHKSAGRPVKLVASYACQP